MREATLPQTLPPKALPRARVLSSPLRYSLSVAAVVLAWLLRLGLDPLLGNVQAFAFFYVAVALSAWWLGCGPALLTLLLGYLAGHWFFLPPRHALWLEDFPDVMELLTYFAVAGTIIVLTRSLRKAEARATANADALLVEKHELEAEITERQRTEAALRQSEHKFRFLVENALVGVYIIQEDHFSYVNPRFAQIFGYSPAELTASVPVSRLVAEADRPRVAEMLRRRLEGEVGQVHYTFQAQRKDATTFDVEVLGALMAYQDKPAVIGTLVDVTERKRAEAILARDRQELERLVRERTARLQETIADLEHFSYSITHDLHAPLRAIHGFAGLLEEECGDCFRPQAAELFQRIKTASSRMDTLLHDALAYAKVARADLPAAPVDLSRLLAAIIQDSPHLQPGKVELRVEGKLPTVLGNEAALSQCFSHLLDNAVKFVAPAVKPRVRIWAEPADVERRSVGASERQGFEPAVRTDTQHASRIAQHTSGPSTLNPQPSTRFVRICIQDSGIGIPKDQHEKIFAMFQRLHGEDEYPGTGIGLALVRKAVQRMGGRVGVDSELGQGSRFWVELPVPALAVLQKAA